MTDDQIISLVEKAKQPWVYKRYDGRDALCRDYRQRVEQLSWLDEAALLKAGDDNPHRVAAFFQVLFFDVSPKMLEAVWRVLCGADIISVELHYEDPVGPGGKARFSMIFTVGKHYDPLNNFTVVTSHVTDASVLRHIGLISTLNVMDGFYPLRLTDGKET